MTLRTKTTTATALIAIIMFMSLAPIAAAESVNPSRVTIARLKYFGGGDWYWGNSSLPNLINYIKQNTSIPISDDEVRVSLQDDRLFNFPFIYITGHGPIKLAADEADKLNHYLTSGGFLFANDSYGLRESFVDAMKDVFPDIDPVEIPFTHGLFSCYYSFPNGLPKIHKHDGLPPQAYGWFSEGRLVALLAYESDIGDGWEDPQVHNDPQEVREQAFKMGVNILTWALMN
ncbi:MAG: DUF4159 domain-containing protein [Candidatus Zixiibacteriota bacterium]